MARQNGASSTSNKSAQELRQWYDENHRMLENFEAAKDAIRQLRDVTKTSSKSTGTFSKETLRMYLQNLNSNEENVRNLSWFLVYRNHTYARIINFYANMFCLYARSIIPNYSLQEDNDRETILKEYEETIDMVELMHLQQEFFNIYTTCFIQDVFYGLYFLDDTGVFIYPIPARYGKIAGKYMSGEFAYYIDMTYFRNRRELLDYMPDPLESMYREYENTNIKWQLVPEEYSICLKYRTEDYETIIPPFVGIFNSLISLSDLEDIQAITDEQDIYKMIWLQMETLTNTKDADDWKVDPSLMIEYFNRMVNDALPPYTSAAIVPGKLDTISFNNDASTDTNKVAKATETVLNTAGGAEVLNGATITTTAAYNAAMIAATEYAISTLLPQTQAFVNRMLTYHVTNPCCVKFMPISAYTKEQYRKNMLESAQFGLPTKLAYNTLNGFSEKDTLALNFLEEDVLGITDKFVPLKSSYTSTDYRNGAPKKDDSELTDEGERSRNR